jgi:hypothetical protein
MPNDKLLDCLKICGRSLILALKGLEYKLSNFGNIISCEYARLLVDSLLYGLVDQGTVPLNRLGIKHAVAYGLNHLRSSGFICLESLIISHKVELLRESCHWV